MENYRKKKQILNNIEYNNLLGFSFVQNKLEKNFKSIVQALLINQTQTAQLKEDLKTLNDSTNLQLLSTNNKLSNLQKKLNDLQNRQNNPSTSSHHHSQKNTQQSKNNQQTKNHQSSNISQANVNVPRSSKQINTNQSKEILPSIQQLNLQPKQQNHQDPNYQHLLDNYQELRDKIDNLLQNQINPSQLDKKLNTMKDNINLLKAEVKAINDRESKSAKRASLFNNNTNNIIQPLPVNNNNTDLSTSGEKDHQYLQQMNAIQQQIQKQINGLHIEINTLKLTVEELKDSYSQNRRKDNRINILVQELSKSQKKLQQRLKSSNQSFDHQIKQIKSDILNLQMKSPADPQQSTLKKSKKYIEGKDNTNSITKQNISPNANQQINDRISKLQAAIQGLVTESQFKRLKDEVKDKFEYIDQIHQNIKKQLKDEIQNLTDILDNKQLQIYQINKNIDTLKDKTNDLSCECQRRNHITSARLEQLKKSLQNLKEDLQFYKSMNQATNGQHKIDIQPLSQNTNNDSKKSTTLDNKTAEELKKYLNRKIHDQRTYLLGLIRDLQKKSGNKSNFQQDFTTLWDKLAQLNLFLQKKANQQDVRKNLSYLQKKLATLYQRLTTSDENNEDARLAKTNWFCLSCDKNLQNYQGKVGQHVVWDSMPIKGNYTKYYGREEKKALPTLKR